MLSLVPAAFAHSGTLPHLHADAPAAVGVLAGWLVLASLWAWSASGRVAR